MASDTDQRRNISVNFFGAVATLEGQRPVLAKPPRPRAVAICSTAAMLPVNDDVAARCLAGNEQGALALTDLGEHHSYCDSKRALALWIRRNPPRFEWAGSGILLNGVAPGVVDTPMNSGLHSDPAILERVRQTNPMALAGFAQADEIAELATFLAAFENHYLLGQIIYIDGGTDVIMRPDRF